MFNQDYIMRMIEQLVRGIALVAGLKQENRLEESSQVLSDTLRKFYGLNDSALEQLPWRGLMTVASFGSLPDAERCALLAQLVKEKADLEQLQERVETAGMLYGKALGIYLAAVLADHAYFTLEHTAKVDELTDLAGRYRLPDEIPWMLFEYFELSGRYSKAEDVLYERFADEGCEPEQFVGTATAFYHRLLQMDDAELQRGGLPRDEVLAGLVNTEKMKRQTE